MTLPQITPPPVIGYAGAEAIQLDSRALVRIRIGTGFLIAYLVSSLIRLIVPNVTLAVQATITICAALCLAVAACLLAANTRLPSERLVFRRLLVGTAVFLVVVATAHAVAMYVFFGNGIAPNVSRLWILNVIYPFSSTAYATVQCLCFLRLADLSRRFRARTIAMQCLVVAGIFLALYAYYLLYGFLAVLASSGLFRSLSWFIALFRSAVCLWAAIFLAVLLPRLKSHLPS